MIANIEQLPVQAEATVHGLTEIQFDTPYREEGWTPRQVIHHIADTHLMMFIRTKRTLTEDNPTLKPFNQDVWIALPDSTGPIEPSLDIIRGVHKRWAELLKSIPDSGWERPAYHPERGNITLESMTAAYSDHGANHVAQITALRNRNGW